MNLTANDLIYFLSPLTLAAVISDLHEGASDPELSQSNRGKAGWLERECRKQLKNLVGTNRAERLIEDAKSV